MTALQKPKAAANDSFGIGEIPPLGQVPEKMLAWAVRKERHGPPEQSMQIEVLPTWPVGDDEVLVFVMAAGVNYNGVWAALGEPISPHDVHKCPHHIAGSDAVRRGVGGRQQGQALEGRRRGRGPLQPGRWRRRGVQWRRPDVLVEPAHLGLRDAGWLLRAVLPRPVAPAHGEAEAPHVGRGGLLHADPRDRLPHAVRASAAHREARRQRAGMGCVRRPRRVRRATLRCFRRQRHRRHLRRLQARLRHGARRQGRHQPQGIRLLGPVAQGEQPRIRRVGEGRPRLRQGHLGHHRQEGRGHRLRASRRGDVPGVDAGRQARRHDRVLRRHVRL